MKKISLNLQLTSLFDKCKLYNKLRETFTCDTDGNEFIFDLRKKEDIDFFKILYGCQTFDRCVKISNFWLGGNNFYANEDDKNPCCCTKIRAVTEENVDHLLDFYTEELVDFYHKDEEYTYELFKAYIDIDKLMDIKTIKLNAEERDILLHRLNVRFLTENEETIENLIDKLNV
jgi:hypothetical protein